MVSTYPSPARVWFGRGGPGEVRRAADITVGIGVCAGRRFSGAFLLGRPWSAGRATRFLTRYVDFAPVRGEYRPQCEPDGARYPERCKSRKGPIEESGWPRGFSIVFRMGLRGKRSQLIPWRMTPPLHEGRPVPDRAPTYFPGL